MCVYVCVKAQRRCRSNVHFAHHQAHKRLGHGHPNNSSSWFLSFCPTIPPHPSPADKMFRGRWLSKAPPTVSQQRNDALTFHRIPASGNLGMAFDKRFFSRSVLQHEGPANICNDLSLEPQQTSSAMPWTAGSAQLISDGVGQRNGRYALQTTQQQPASVEQKSSERPPHPLPPVPAVELEHASAKPS